MTTLGKTAVVMLTHTDTPRLIKHFERLESEAGIPAFRARHLGLLDPGGGPASFEINNHALARQLPTRYTEMLRLNRSVVTGYTDLVVFGAATHPLVSAFEYLWLLEGDVDFSGRWSDFFSLYADNDADLIACRVRRRSEEPDWTNWPSVKVPTSAEPLAAFLPATRLSRRFIEIYCREIRTPGWQGHHEMTEASLAFAHGLKIENMDGSGEFAARQTRAPLDMDTFDYRPVRSTSYFHEAPENFEKPNFLYHPVKPNEKGMRLRGATPSERRFSLSVVRFLIKTARKRLLERDGKGKHSRA